MTKAQIMQWADFNRITIPTRKNNSFGLFMLGVIAGMLVVLAFFSVQGCTKTYRNAQYWSKPMVGRSEVYQLGYGRWYYNNSRIKFEDIDGEVQ